MAKQTLNAGTIAALPNPKKGQVIVWDTKLPRFGVRLTKSAKTYICEDRVKGRTRRVSIASVGTLTVAEARKEAQKLLGQMATNVDVNQAKAEERAKTITLREAVDLYLKGRALRDSTLVANRNLLNANFGDWMKKELRNITPNMVVQRFDRISKNSPAVANSACRVLRACWNYARADTASDSGQYTLPENPCHRLSDLKKWHKPKRRQKHLTNDQYPAFFKGLDKVRNETASNRHKEAGPMLADFAELVLRTGLRKTEAATLRWDHVNFADRTFSIPPEQAKNGNELVLPMSTQVQTILKRRYACRGKADQVFPGGGAMGDPRKTLNRLRKAVGDADLGFHDLRRSFAVQCERLDVSHSKIKRLLNHADGGDVTMGYLVSTDPERLREVTQAISDEMDRLAKHA